MYQDLGNSIFSFLGHKKFHSVERNMRILCNALSTFGIDAIPTGLFNFVVFGVSLFVRC